MKKIILIFYVLTVSVMAFAQSDEAVQKEIEALERQRFEAQVKKDIPTLEKIFAADLIYTHSSGKVDNKESYITSIKEGKSVYEKIEVENIGIRVYNKQQTALVNGQVFINMPAPNNATTVLHLRYSVTYIKDKKLGWQLANWQSLKLAN
jgi:hypothetical protein